jgi:hypothetical protein
VLGAYLGDGCINVFRSGAASLIVSLDLAYPQIINAVDRAIRKVFPAVAVFRVFPEDASLAVVRASHPALPFAFPEHGPGRKHLREIRLTEWQRT